MTVPQRKYISNLKSIQKSKLKFKALQRKNFVFQKPYFKKKKACVVGTHSYTYRVAQFLGGWFHKESCQMPCRNIFRLQCS